MVHSGWVQALLDMYTIQREVGHLDKLKIGLVGDLANGRTVRSLAYLLSMYDNVKMYFVAPDVVRMKDDIKEFLSGRSASRSCCTFCLHALLCGCIRTIVCQHLQPGISTKAEKCPRFEGKVVLNASVLNKNTKAPHDMHVSLDAEEWTGRKLRACRRLPLM